jgi:hypothetical protein
MTMVITNIMQGPTDEASIPTENVSIGPNLNRTFRVRRKAAKRSEPHRSSTSMRIHGGKSRLLFKWKPRIVLPLILVAGMVTFDLAKKSSMVLPVPPLEEKQAEATFADKEQDFCTTTGSLHNLTFQMANYSSPVGSPSYLKMQHILRISSRFHINSRDEIFERVEQNMADMLESYGLTRLLNSTINTTIEDPQDIIRIEMSYHGAKKEGSGTCVGNASRCQQMPRIILQSEQLKSYQWKEYRGYLTKCHEASNCIIWDFSDLNYRVAQEGGIGDCIMLLPIMTQSRLGFVDYVPPLSNRSMDLALFGLPTKRRTDIRTKLKEANYTMVFEWSFGHPYLISTYLNSKICLIVHKNLAESAGEYHRLSEVAPMGCIPVMEDFMDVIGRKEYQDCGGVIVANYTDILVTLSKVLSNEATTRNNNKYVAWWKRGIRWKEVLTTIFPSAEHTM